jgi:glucokinase
MSLLAIDLGGTKLASALFSPAGDLLLRESVPTAGQSGRKVGALIAERASALRSRADAGGDAVTAIGVAVPGIYRAASGTVWAPNIADWDDYPLLEELTAGVGQNLPVRIDSDRAASVLGESWRGAAAGRRNAIFVAVGTGIGVGLLVDGNVLHGHGDIAGAIGWLAVRQPYRPEYEACGCLEHHAAGPGLVKVARAKLAADPRYVGPLRGGTDDPSTPTAAQLFSLYDTGDPIATAVVDDAVSLWGMMTANLVSLFNPEIIVFGGGIFGPATRFLDRIREEATRWAQPISMGQVTLTSSTLGGDAGLYGAAQLAWRVARGA